VIVQYTVLCDNALLAQKMTTLRRRSAAALSPTSPAVGARAQQHSPKLPIYVDTSIDHP
jgi:hypothetical protein